MIRKYPKWISNLTITLACLGISMSLFAQGNPYKAPLYWSVYEHHIIKEEAGVANNYIPESELLSNIDFVAANLKDAGYTMICMDGWGDVSRVSPHGYRMSHSRNWSHDFAWWSSYLQSRGMSLGIYENPLWIHVSPSDTNTLIVGTTIPVSSLIDTSEHAKFTWCQVERPGAEQYIKGYVKYYADMGVKYLRVDFLSWYESGWDRYMGQVGPTNRPHADYVTTLKWMREAADTNGMFLSLVMPNLFTTNLYDGGPVSDAAVEREYGHMIRVNEDCGDGNWWKWSDKNRGVQRVGWSVYANAMDGLTYWSHIAGRSKMILDPDFIRINTFANDEEKKSVISACLLAGGAVTPTDQYKTICNNVWVYVNPEMLALNQEGFVSQPLTNDPTQVSSQIWTGQTTNGDWIIGLFNRENTVRARSINFSLLGLGSANARDLWAHTNLGSMTSFLASIPAHGCRVLRISTNVLSGLVPIHVQSIVTNTLSSPTGGRCGTATVTIEDNAGNPVTGATVYVVFSGSYHQTVFGVTDTNGIVTVQTTAAVNGDIKVTVDVSNVTCPGKVYSADRNLVSTVGDHMFVAGTFSNWRLKDNPMQWVNGVWQVISVPLKAGNYELKFADTDDWSGDDWGNATGLSGTANLATGGAPNLAFTIISNGLYKIAFNPDTLAYAIQLQWQTDDIGSVAAVGSANYDANDAFTLLGSGWDIQSAADSFRYTYQSCAGDTDMRARVTGIQDTDPWAKAGVMIRESAAANARYAAIFVTPENGVTFQWRKSTGGSTSTTTVGGLSVPEWVRIQRLGNTLVGYFSADGLVWTQIGSGQTINMSTSATIGLAVTSHNDGTLTTSTMDNTVVGPLNMPPSLTAIPNQEILAGRTLALTNSASDNDSPAQTLLYQLINPPSGAEINATNGVFTWRPSISESPSTETITVMVSDNGIPSMSATQSFQVAIQQPACPTLDMASICNGHLGFRITGDTGPDYVVQTSTNLVAWSALATLFSPPMPMSWVDTNPTESARFYRIRLGP